MTQSIARAIALLALAAVSLSAASALPAAASSNPAATSSDSTSSDEQTLWHYEQSIYAGRAQGDLSFYVNHADPAYAGWPPQSPAPFGRDELAAQARRAAGQNGEKLVLEKNLIRFTADGKTALVFYTTHRTARADGLVVDERFENIHVWLRRDSGWMIVGGMSRPMPANRAALAAPLPAATLPAASAMPAASK
jgi:ketosteroid isomerase-like protein